MKYWPWFLMGFVAGFFLAALFNAGLLGCTLLGVLVGAAAYLCSESDDKAAKKDEETD